ncbi:MAG: outer membrane protein transport protein [Gammaproteobacteria bacterium]
MQTPFVRSLSTRSAVAGLLACSSSASLASGFALIDQSASQMGNSFAGGSAFSNDASTIYFNPAGMTRLPTQLVVGAHYIDPDAKFRGEATDIFGRPVSGGNGGDSGKAGVIPNFYISRPMGDGVYAGLGINAPFGLSTEYDNDWKGRYLAIESRVETVNINPAIAFKLSPRLSFGAGLNLQYIRAKLTQAVDQGNLCAPTQAGLAAIGAPGADPARCAGLLPQSSDGFAKVIGDNWAGGYNFGFLYEPFDSTRVGFSYRSQIKQEVTGKARFRNILPEFSDYGLFVNTDVTADVDLPETASLSIWQDLGNWSVMADATWTGWDSFEELRIEYDSNQPDTVVDESWNNTWRYSVGVNWRYNSKWTFRAGTAYDQTPIPNAQHRTARIPGEDRIWSSFGVGYRFSESLAIDLAYARLFLRDKPEINETSAGAGNLNGEYRNGGVDIVSAQLVWNI